jgi:hypothetical protein
MSPVMRRNTMVLAVVALAALVGADRMGWLPTAEVEADNAGTATTPRDRYLESAESVALDRALLASAGQTAAALEDAQSRWAQVRSECVVGNTAELAEASFRERILAATRDLGIQNANAAAVRVESAPTAATSTDRVLRPIALRVQFDTDKPQEIYRVVDVLENLPDIRTSITAISLVGPGLPQVPNQVTASITVGAIAVVGEAEK